MKPCAHCGSTTAVVAEFDYEMHNMVCDCGVQGPTGKTKKEAKQLWDSLMSKLVPAAVGF